jgi:hypothetical protein
MGRAIPTIPQAFTTPLCLLVAIQFTGILVRTIYDYVKPDQEHKEP